ncbi:MAG: NF038122 family metalloprotease [Phycisphaerales bacterium]
MKQKKMPLFGPVGRMSVTSLGLALGMFSSVSMIHAETGSSSGVQFQQQSPLDRARIVGPVGQPMLVVPMEVPAWAARLGVTEMDRTYKGLCGPSGAAITVAELYRSAEQDLNRLGQQRGAETTELVGSSPGFAMTYDPLDATLVALYLPTLRRAIEYIDESFDNRVRVDASIGLGTFSGNVIGSAGSARYTIPWSVYVEGLRTQAVREDARFANELPDSFINVLYDGSSTTSTTEMSIRVTDAQLRAIFGDNAIPRDTGVSITFNSASSWNFLGCDIDPESNQQSLIDVAVHEFTHSMGFTSEIREGGNNPDNNIQGLDVARFRAGNLPFNNGTFTSNPRVGEVFANELHFYSSFPTGGSTLLEGGDGHQPSHLNYTSNSEDKLGVMDPVIVTGTTRCPDFYTADDLQPLDDMGWNPVRINDFQDCNGNQVLDLLDILSGVSLDVDGDRRPDECESFFASTTNPNNASGVVRTVYEVPGLTDLSFFDPNGSGTTIVSSEIVSDISEVVSFGSSATRVIDYEGFIFVPSRDEYAFRVEHPSGMNLLINNLVIGQSDRSGSLERSESSTNISSQSFMQLEAGWHPIFVQFLSTGSTANVRLVRESRGTGGWSDVASSQFQVTNEFADCDGNGSDDSFDMMNDQEFVFDLGVVGESDTPIDFDTLGSSFDTEIALWDSNGTLVDTNDDIDGGPIRQSGFTATLSPGQYTFAITGYNTLFTSGPAYSFSGGCSDSGAYVFNIDGSEIVSGTIPSGRAHIFSFTIGSPDCDGDGTPDSAELDCDGNGIPDDCEIPTVANAESVGTMGTSDVPFVFSTCGSGFDTEIAIWSDDGTLIAENDDFCGLQSEISVTLPVGSYYAALSGYDIEFGENFDMTINANGACSEGGELDVALGYLHDTGDMNQGRIILVGFDIEAPQGCTNQADLNGDGVLNFLDISEFLSAFGDADPIADFVNDGFFNFLDVSAFLSEFADGCP